ncbi:Arginine utilization protein RocB [Desulfotomaculum arcticum]|uniref:Arginine utilization protein RocB n=1 Tax=Desulfotruncus arcticus DSM 17038 TaxID=1121424 RepID=A0A1I2PGM4_9FIRM|nr:M20/M25/M40 family metallo-hydrolase [Desulfotruncus arcticus]SFG12591.1 Arginine utilization protein RocB [Desulfotomaculum arcticum] [Desulfotruncus arcticus DSM 17038]
MPFYKDVKELTLKLVGIPSMNNSAGETILAEAIAEYLRKIDYFKQHPDYVWEVPLKDDLYGRKNVFALIKGQKGNSSRTVILHGHIDTVGVDDFGILKEYAFDPAALKRKLKDVNLPPEVKQDLDSGEWIFGRGVTDMKSGVAAHMVVIKEISKMARELEGNILFMANPVEENQHTGIIEALPALQELQEKYGLEYVVAINNDYISPLYNGDKKKYIYMGAVGKLLPCFYIVGRETHVGQCYEGLDPNLIAAELLKSINLNADLCDQYKGEYTLPPTALKLTDLKPAYNVQTPLASFLYFNYFTHDIPVDKVLEMMKEKAYEAFVRVINFLDHEYQKYCKFLGQNYQPLSWKPKVITYKELYDDVKQQVGPALDHKISQLVKEMLASGTDTRLICLKVVEEVKSLSGDKDPVVVIFFAPPYCPHNTVKGESARGREVMQVIKDVIEEMSAATGEEFEIRQFFPSLSDSSYLKIDDPDESINALINNFPEWENVYPVPVKKIRQLNIPAINFGAYGKDAHKWTERLNKKYTFSVLPRMTILAIDKFLHS